MEVQSQAVQSTSQIKHNNLFRDEHPEEEEDDASEDGCPNFSIYSTESINIAKTTDLELLSENSQNTDGGNNHVAYGEVSSTPTAAKSEVTEENAQEEDEEEEKVEVEEEVPDQDVDELASKEENKETAAKVVKVGGGLYSDDEDEVKIYLPKPFGIGDIRNMTEDISEEERSYTPCLDEKGGPYREGLEGLDTELISDEDRNDFDESHEPKTSSDGGDALEINAKESELDFTKPEDYEEGEIVDKINKAKKLEESKEEKSETPEPKKAKKKDKDLDDRNKENENQNKESFKKLSKSNKERNYRDKDNKAKSRSRSKSRKRDKPDKEGKREKKKEKRKEIERYDVRTIIAEKPRRLKDKFGRDIKHRSGSRSSRSLTPHRSVSRGRRSNSRERRTRRGRSRDRRSLSRSRSSEHRRSRSRTKKRRRSSSREVAKRRKSRDQSRVKSRKNSSRSRNKTRSPSPKRRRDWDRRRSWTPSMSKSPSPEPGRHLSPSWTPPRIMDQSVKPRNLTVILTNDSNKKKKDKKKRSEKKNKDPGEKQKKRRRERTPPPSKEVFASGDNILVSVSFNKDSENRDVTTAKRKRDVQEPLTTKKARKEKRVNKLKRGKDLSGVKPVAIIDLDRSPFKELTPSPKDIIVLSDSDNAEGNDLLGLQKAMCDSSQQVASPERAMSNNYSTGPKTPPEPQIKFSLNTKQPQMRPITNPLHEPDEPEEEIDPQEELEQRLNEVIHKGPNTPPEPPNSPPSSPDAYDPFDPTKSRSPTPEPLQNVAQSNSTSIDDNREDSMLDNR